MPDAVTELAEYIRSGLPAAGDSARSRLKRLFTADGPYLDRRDTGDSIFRDAYGLANDDGTPWAGLVHPSTAPTGVYGGASLVWFPTHHGSLLTLIVGTGGIAPDEGLLTSPGHRRRVAALRRYLTQNGIAAWSKPDPALLDLPVPSSVLVAPAQPCRSGLNEGRA